MKFPSYGYLIILLFSLAGLLTLDYSRSLAIAVAPRRTLLTVAVCVGFFALWDIAGIGLAIFQTNRDFVSGIYLVTPNLPLEEFILLTLISYFTLLVTLLLARREP